MNDDSQLSLAVRAAGEALSRALVDALEGEVSRGELSRSLIAGLVAGGLPVGSLTDWDRALGAASDLVTMYVAPP